jgi:hypothetical protein
MCWINSLLNTREITVNADFTTLLIFFIIIHFTSNVTQYISNWFNDIHGFESDEQSRKLDSQSHWQHNPKKRHDISLQLDHARRKERRKLLKHFWTRLERSGIVQRQDIRLGSREWWFDPACRYFTAFDFFFSLSFFSCLIDFPSEY